MRIKLANVVLTCVLCAPLWAESAGGLTWTAPAGWANQGARPMRAATYSVPAAAGDAEGGECAVYYFGAGQGGGVQANLKRWVGQFRAPDGGPADKLAKPGKMTSNGVTITTLDLTGTYMFRPSPRAPKATPKPGYRLLAAIAEGPEGSVFFKFTAPAKTSAASNADFDKMLSSIRK